MNEDLKMKVLFIYLFIHLFIYLFIYLFTLTSVATAQ